MDAAEEMTWIIGARQADGTTMTQEQYDACQETARNLAENAVFHPVTSVGRVALKNQLIAQKRNLCNILAEFDRDIARLQMHRAAVDAGIQAIDEKIGAMVDKPPEK